MVKDFASINIPLQTEEFLKPKKNKTNNNSVAKIFIHYKLIQRVFDKNKKKWCCFSIDIVIIIIEIVTANFINNNNDWMIELTENKKIAIEIYGWMNPLLLLLWLSFSKLIK